MPERDDIWYAAEATRVILAPKRELETFGETSIHYCVLAPLLDEMEKVRIREGLIVAERPQVITPRYFVNRALQNFGQEAQQYIERILASSEGMSILQYGLRFRKEEHKEEVVQGETKEVADQIALHNGAKEDGLYGVIIGVDDLWEVSLLKFVGDIVRSSAGHNARELSGRGLLDMTSGNVPNAVRIEIESDFKRADGNRELIHHLGNKLREYGLFNEYEDRFFQLLRAAR